MKIPDGFRFISLSLPKGGGLIVRYGFSTNDGSITNHDEIEHTCPSDVHEDMERLVKQLRKYVADTYNMLAFNSLAKNNVAAFTAKEQSAVKNIQPVYDKLVNEVLDKIEITAIKFKGNEASRGVVIYGKNNYGKAGTALNTPFINLNQERWGWESELDEILDMIVEESKNYLFSNKRKAPEIEFPAEAEEELAATGTDNF